VSLSPSSDTHRSLLLAHPYCSTTNSHHTLTCSLLSIPADIDSELLKCFVTKELMRWPGIEQLYGPQLLQSQVFAPDSKLGLKTSSKTDGKKIEYEGQPGSARWEELHKRVIEHVSWHFQFRRHWPHSTALDARLDAHTP
jgi:hypothetical protein